ncbi:unnamed protein product [Brachionus calyciflorus]|uniref:Uncharacterized protein n=1 Tax=Brachionus calyciflorus TaxID=104777 RepID=A0A814E460_9BILA|nr:unnamed protein product [Brachionus calyciflorus]
MPIEKSLELYKVCEVIDLENDLIFDWFKLKGFIPNSKQCLECLKTMKLVERKDSIDSWTCRCSTDRKRCSLRDNTFLESFYCELKAFLKKVHYWSIQTRQIDPIPIL